MSRITIWTAIVLLCGSDGAVRLFTASVLLFVGKVNWLSSKIIHLMERLGLDRLTRI